jgi:hypothetical protein
LGLYGFPTIDDKYIVNKLYPKKTEYHLFDLTIKYPPSSTILRDNEQQFSLSPSTTQGLVKSNAELHFNKVDFDVSNITSIIDSLVLGFDHVNTNISKISKTLFKNIHATEVNYDFHGFNRSTWNFDVLSRGVQYSFSVDNNSYLINYEAAIDYFDKYLPFAKNVTDNVIIDYSSKTVPYYGIP